MDIKEVIADREAGIAENWVVKWRTDGTSIISMGSVESGPHMQADLPFEKDWIRDVANARRIARVPELEAAVIAAEELADMVDTFRSRGPTPAGGGRVILEIDIVNLERALAAYREATS